MKRFLLLQAIFLTVIVIAQNSPVKLLSQPREYTGIREKTEYNEVVIGVLTPPEGMNRAADDMVRGIQLAAEEISKCDLQGKHISGFKCFRETECCKDTALNQNSPSTFERFERQHKVTSSLIILRPEFDDPWAGGTHEIIDLVVNKKVCALITFGDELSHMALLVAARLRVPVISVATEENLTMTGLPWIFRLPPSNLQQAEKILKRMEELGQEAGVLYSSGFDERKTADKVRTQLEKKGHSPLYYLNVASPDNERKAVFKAIDDSAFHTLILAMNYKSTEKWLEFIMTGGIHLNILLPWTPGLEMSLIKDNVQLLLPFEKSPKWEQFENKFVQKYHMPPSFASGYGYDAAGIIMDAASKQKLNRIAMREGISEQTGRNGVTGVVLWDNGGGNLQKTNFSDTKR